MSQLSSYAGHGIQFHYPAGWELSEESRDEAMTITVSDDAAFWSVTVMRRRPRAERVLEEATQAFREEYEEIDEYPADGLLARREAVGRNLEFVALELINCVFMRAVEVGGRTLFTLAQVTDHERQRYEPVFEAINDSLTPAADEEVLID